MTKSASPTGETVRDWNRRGDGEEGASPAARTPGDYSERIQLKRAGKAGHVGEAGLMKDCIHGSGRFFVGYDFLAKLWLDNIPDLEQKAAIFHVSMFAANRLISYYAPPDDHPRVLIDLAQLSRLTLLRDQRLADTIPLIGRHLERRGAHFYLPDGQWLLTAEKRRRPLSASLRNEIISRDGERCVYCGDGSGPFDIDHLFPVARGGVDAPNNLVVACINCNRSKGDKTLREWREWQSDIAIQVAA